MKASKIFRQYVWITDTIYHSGGITLQELNERWVKTELSERIPMNRLTFNRHRAAIEEIFDINIECRRKGYQYYIENEEILKSNSLKHWMIDSLSVSNVLLESSSLKDRILLENIPSGKKHLQPIINAMKQGKRLLIEYLRFGKLERRQIIVEPYAIKVFKQRWYLLAADDKWTIPAVYALDRIMSLKETGDSFEYPKDFNAEIFFKDCYGVICGTNDEVQKIVLRAYPPYVNYLRTLPLHTSQKELNSTSDYADFELYLRPTFDFRQELLSQGDEVEILQPENFREEMKSLLEKMLKRYSMPK
ncbi:MAG: WYL domain-containing protein [Bacteroides sp.]|nr:WYL domain-containing protein [Bacteroides sp.]